MLDAAINIFIQTAAGAKGQDRRCLTNDYDIAKDLIHHAAWVRLVEPTKGVEYVEDHRR